MAKRTYTDNEVYNRIIFADIKGITKKDIKIAEEKKLVDEEFLNKIKEEYFKQKPKITKSTKKDKPDKNKSRKIENIDELVQKIFDLYIIKAEKYLFYPDKKGYITINASKENNIKRAEKGKKPSQKLKPWNIKNHLYNDYTIGAFAGLNATKFICFDVDIKNSDLAKVTTKMMINTLVDFGINKEYIHLSTSGNKGYHLEIFFTNPINNTLVKKFYDSILLLSKTTNEDLKDVGKVEFRPAYGQGVKIPLSRNWKNEDNETNKCWFLDLDTFEPIKDINYILSIKKLPSEFILDKFQKQYEDEIKAKLKQRQKEIKSVELTNSVTYSIEESELIEREGFKPRNRHNATLKLAVYYKTMGLAPSQCETDLIEWMRRQPLTNYKSEWDEVLEDIKSIVKWVYDNDKAIAKENVIVSKNEVDKILSLKNKSEKILAYAFLIHGKKYSDKNGEFYFTFKSQAEITGLHEDTCKVNINNLEKTGIIEVVKRKQWCHKNNIRRPNIYKILIEDNEIDKTDKTIEVSDEYNLLYCLNSLYDKKELKKILPRRQYQYLTNYIDSNTA